MLLFFVVKVLLAIVGPTAVGKSRLALYLAQFLPVEIINADSRQVYKFMDIGTAKPTPQERNLVPHHLWDIIEPDHKFNLALYLKMVRQVINEIQERGKIPLLVGGSGQYVWAVIEGWQIPPVPPQENLRRELEELVSRGEEDKFYLKLKEVDPLSASKIDPRNIRRVIRALEVCSKLGSFSKWRQKQPPPFPIYLIGLTLPREELYHRIELRVEEMIKRGWVDEVKNLLNMGYNSNLPALSSFGYKEFIDYLKGRKTLEEAIQQIKRRTRNFVRHQYAWFRLNDPRINWFLGREENFPQIKRQVEVFLNAFRKEA